MAERKKRNQAERILKHEQDAAYAKAKAKEWAEKAVKSQARADELRQDLESSHSALTKKAEAVPF